MGIFWGGAHKVIKHISNKQISHWQSGQIVARPHTHTQTHTEKEGEEALWPVCLHCKSFYIIINQFDTFTSALKRKPQGFREVLHKSFMNCKGSGAGTGERERERGRDGARSRSRSSLKILRLYRITRLTHISHAPQVIPASHLGVGLARAQCKGEGRGSRRGERGAPHQCANVRLITHHQS